MSVPVGTQPRLRVVSVGDQRGDSAVQPPTRPIAIVAHAGLGISRAGGAPNGVTLQRAARLAVEAVEVDVCITADRALVLHHDLHTALGTPLSALTLRDLRRGHSAPLTLDEGVDELEGTASIVLDLKTPDAVEPLARWLLRRPDSSRMFVCSDRVDALRALSLRAPMAQIWQTFPNVGRHAPEHVARIISGLFAHRGREALRAAGDVAHVIRNLPLQPNDALARLAGIPWRRLLPRLLGPVREDLGACGIAVHHALVTAELCIAARAHDLTVTAWTVNEPELAQRVAACGVDMITTDRVKAIRRVVYTKPRVLVPRAAVG